MRFTPSLPQPAGLMKAAGAQHRKDLRAAAIVATDRAAKEAQKAVAQRIRSVGLGRLGGAVGQSSMLKEGQTREVARQPYGVIFARGGDESLAGGALEAYSRGATITAQQRQWLAFPTNAIPRFVAINGRRFRTTPQLYKASSLNTTIGPLVFKPIGTDKALLVVKKVTVSPKTGRAKAATGRRTRTRIPQKEVVAFILIKVTVRAKRFDKDDVIRIVAQQVPVYMQQAMVEILARRGRTYLNISPDVR